MAGRSQLGWLLMGLIAVSSVGIFGAELHVGPGGYPTIQDAINSANDGDTIIVAPGVYDLTAPVVVDKPLKIIGAQANVDPRPSTGGRTGPETVLRSSTTVFDIQADNVEINGFFIEAGINNSHTNIVQDNNKYFTSQNVKVLYNIITNTGSSMNEAVKIRVGDSPLIAYNYIYNTPAPGDAINFDRVTNGRIEYNEIFNNGSENAAIYVYGSTGVWIIGNIVDTTSQNDGIKLGSKNGADATKSEGVIAGNIVRNTAQDGITVYMSDVIVEDNTVTGSHSENGAVYLAFGISNVVIRYNTIVDNDLNPSKWGSSGGITIGSAVNVSTVQIYGNTLTGNDPVDVANMASGTPLLDATGNWWGQDTGPLPGQIAGNVAYSPWLGNDPSQATWTFIVAQAGPQLPAGYLQTALNLARDGDVVLVKAGEYETQGLIEKSLVLLGEQGAVIKAPDSRTTYTIAESSRTFDPIIFAYGGTMVGSHVSGDGVISADVKGLVIDGQDKARAHPIRFVGILYRNVHGEISGNVIRNMMNPGGGGGGAETFGILVYGDSVVDVLNNVVSGFSRGGIGISGDAGPAPDPRATVSGNVVIGNGLETATGWWAENGIQIGYGATGVISGNLVTQCWVNSPDWTATGILVASTDDVVVEGNTVVNNESGIGVAGFGIWGLPSSNENLVRGNDVIGNMWGVDIQMDANNTLVIYNNIAGNTGAGVSVAQFYGYEPMGTIIRFNSIVGNALGVENYGVSTDIDAALNWWGSPEGPTHASNPDGVGDAVTDNVIYSPWLGADPDGDPTQPGVQITGPILIIVDDVGPEPDGGYLNAAIAGANELPYADTIEVRHGTYDASQPVTDPVTIVSEEGSASHTTLTGDMSFRSAGILLGRLRRGFTILGNITVEAGADASTIHINWNDIFGLVVNEGDGVLDATYNWWGGRHPILDDATEGLVHVYPYLPRPSDEVIQFMDEHHLNPDEALLVLWLLDRGVPEPVAFMVLELIRKFGLSRADALQIIRDYGLIRVGRALRRASTYEEFVRLLIGYSHGPAGGAGGFLDQTVAGGAGAYQGLTIEAVYTVGTPIGISFSLTDYAGEPVTDAVCTVTMVKMEDDGHQMVVGYHLIPYNPDTGLYELSLPTAGLEPGYYMLYIGFGDGSSERVLTQLVGE